MNTRLLLTLIITLITFFSGTTQGWIRDYGNQDGNSGNAVVQTSDGGYTLTGQWVGRNPYILRTDADGNMLWQAVFSSIELGYGTDITSTSDGGFAITGHNQPPTFDEAPTLLLAKADANGNILWQREFFEDYPNVTDSIEYNIGKQVIETPDGGLLAVGETSGIPRSDVFMVKTDANGNELWHQTFGVDTLTYEVIKLMSLPAGGYAIAGSIVNLDPAIFPAARALFLLQIDEQGNELDFDMYPIAQGNKASGAVRAADGSFYLTSSRAFFNSGQESSIFKLDAAGNLLWEKISLIDFDILQDIQVSPQGELVISGIYPRNPNSFEYLVTLAKLDAEAEALIWRREIPFGLNNFNEAMIPTSDGGYAIAGRVQYEVSWPYGQNAMLVKTNNEGYVYTCTLDGDVFLDEN
ncbi:MAG: hypothetical protein KDD01_17340, partial [Phaeodactylibacter sp.]|nr:hypothetical protein [Phaeodactylibacter sp.]